MTRVSSAIISRRDSREGKKATSRRRYSSPRAREPAAEPVYIYASRNPVRPEKSDTPRAIGDAREFRFPTWRCISPVRRILAFGVTGPTQSVSDHDMGVAYCSSSGAYQPERRDYVCAISRTHARTHSRTHAHTSSRVSLCLFLFTIRLFSPRFSFSLRLFPALTPTTRVDLARSFFLFFFFRFILNPPPSYFLPVASFSSSYVLYSSRSLFRLL